MKISVYALLSSAFLLFVVPQVLAQDIEVHYPVSDHFYDDISPFSDVRNGIPSINGGFFLSGTSSGKELIVKFTSQGTVDTTFGRDGYVFLSELGQGHFNSVAYPVVEDSHGRLYVMLAQGFAGQMQSFSPPAPIYHHLLVRLLPNGALDPAFQPFHHDKVHVDPTLTSHYAVDSKDRVVLAWEATKPGTSQPGVFARRILPDGSPDIGFGNNGLASIESNNAIRIGYLQLDDQDRPHLLTLYFSSDFETRYYRLTESGHPDPSFGSASYHKVISDRTGFADAKITHHDNRIYVFSQETPPASSSDRLRVAILDGQGQLIETRFINNLPLSLFTYYSCFRAQGEWHCLADFATRQPHLGSDFPVPSMHVKRYDDNFESILPDYSIIRPPIRSIESGRSERVEISPIVIEGVGFFLPTNTTTNEGSNVGLWRFDFSSGWDTSFGTNGRKAVTFVGARARTDAVAVDSEKRWIAGIVKETAAGKLSVQLKRYFATGRQDNSFGINGTATLLETTTERPTFVADMKFNDSGELFVLLVAEDGLRVYRVNDTYQSSSSLVIARIFHTDTFRGLRSLGMPNLAVTPNDEVIITYTKAAVDGNVASSPTATILHIDRNGNPVESRWTDGIYQVFFEGLRTTRPPFHYSLSVSQDNALKLIQSLPQDGAGSSFVYQRIDLSQRQSAGEPQILFSFPQGMHPSQVVKLTGTDGYLVLGESCLEDPSCEGDFAPFYWVLSENGEPLPTFNNGEPLIMYDSLNMPFYNHKAYQFQDTIVAVATQNRGDYPQRDSASFGVPLINAGNAFALVTLDLQGNFRNNESVFFHVPGREEYFSCAVTRDQQGICAVSNDSKAGVRILQWSGKPGPDSKYFDSDGDGIPDEVEIAWGLDPYDPNDAHLDPDGDGRTYLVRYLEGDSSFTSPTLVVPSNVRLPALSAYTYVDSGSATAMDHTGLGIPVSSNSKQFYPPGSHDIVWSATDANGNAVHKKQRVFIDPVVSFLPSAYAREGRNYPLQAFLNGYPVEYPVLVPFSYQVLEGEAELFGNVAFVPISFELSGYTNTTPRASLWQSPVVVSFSMDEPIGAKAGGNSTTIVDLTEQDVVFSVYFTITQQGKPVSYIDPRLGEFEVQANISSTAPPSSIIVDWSKSDESLVFNSIVDGSSLYVSTDSLADGFYTVSAVLSRRTPRAELVTFTDLVKVSTRDLPTEDCTENLPIDSSQNRIPDCLYSDDRPFLVLANSNWYDPIQAESHLGLRLGNFAQQTQLYKAGLDLRDWQDVPLTLAESQYLQIVEDDNLPDLVFDFEIYRLPYAGSVATVVIPLDKPLISTSKLKVFVENSGWREFTAEPGNALSYAQRINGICPYPNHVAYSLHSMSNSECLQVRVTDGGKNDSDGALNGVIRFVGGVSHDVSEPHPPSAAPTDTTRSGGLVSAHYWLLLLLICCGTRRLAYRFRSTSRLSPIQGARFW